MTKQECIDFMIKHMMNFMFPLNSDFNKNQRKVMDEYEATHGEMPDEYLREALDNIHFNLLYEHLKDEGFFEVSEIKRIDSAKVVIIQEGSCDINELEAMGFTVITYRQGSIAPTLLK